MLGPDSFYTPTPLANKLASYITENSIKTAIDFCIGDGDLLKSVRSRFGDITFYGTDISRLAIEKLEIENSNWILDVCDFRDDDAIKQIPFLNNASFDLIVLNPPFTCKGSIVERIEFEGTVFKVSTAMMFLMKAIRFLSSTGGLYAILPISCVYSQKDRKAWDFLQANYNACVLEEPERYNFGEKCAPNIVLVYLGHQIKSSNQGTIGKVFRNSNIVGIVRGCVRMQKLEYSDSPNSLPLIHTTNIQQGELVNLKRILPGTSLLVNGNGVVIPRVCNPNRNKIAVLDGKSTYLLSDCVIVLRTKTKKEANLLRKSILNNWSSFVSIYKGTGAKYTTLERVQGLFGLSKVTVR